MEKGSIIPWVEALATKAGAVDKDNADGYPTIKITLTGLAQAAFLD